MRLKGVAWISVAAAFAACGSDPVRQPRGDGVLVLEVGGEQPSLRAALQAAGHAVEAPHLLQPQPEVVPDPIVPAPSTQQQQEQRQGQQPATLPEPEPTPPPATEWVTVPLPEGETLIHVARRHLGDGRRFVELLEWNGWSDADARKLPKNTPVRIKSSELRQR